MTFAGMISEKIKRYFFYPLFLSFMIPGFPWLPLAGFQETAIKFESFCNYFEELLPQNTFK